VTGPAPHDDAVLRAGDAVARRLARSEFERPVMVEAGAGTGKTTIAVERIVIWSLGPGWERWERELRRRGQGGPPPPDDPGLRGRDAEAPPPEDVAREVFSRIVAITFTEAAAAEMGTRVGLALRTLERGEAPEGFDADALPPNGPERRERSRALLGALDQLVVRTIHAFCRRLLAEHPLELGLHPRFAVDADGAEVEAAVREVLEEALPDLLASPEAALLAARGQGLHAIEEALAALASDAVAPEAFEADPLAPERIAALRDRALAALDAFLAAEGGHIAGQSRAPSQAEAARQLAELRDRVADLVGAGDLEALVAWLAEDGKGGGLPDQLRSWSKGSIAQAAAKRLDADALQALAAAAGPAAEEVGHLACLDPALLAAAHRLLGPLVRRVQERLRRRGVVTFAGLLREARRLLTEHEDVGRKVRRRIDQLLVDEFQDTDRTQCELLRRLVLDAPGQERPGLFLVGDPKQSIYGWRDADLAAYDDFREEVRRAGGQIRSLVVNHRSVPAVLAEVERVVAPSMRAERGVQPPFEPLLPSPKRAEDPGFEAGTSAAVEHWVSWAWDPAGGAARAPNAGEAAALEARALAADLVRLHRDHGVAWKEVGLLFRSTGDLETYLDALRRAGVPFAVERDRSFYRRREVVEAAALVRAVLDPHDQLALLAVLRSAWVGVPDAALIPLWAQGLPDRARELGVRGGTADTESWKSLREAVAAAAREMPAGIPGLERVAGWEEALVDALQTLAALRASFAADPADVFVEKLRALPLLEAAEGARYLGPFRVANLDRFFRGLADALAEGEADVAAVLRALRRDVSGRREAEEGRPPEAAEDAVQVLTIHRAKGLAFQHVYVVQLHKGSGGSGRAEVSPEEGPGGWELPLLGAPSLGGDLVAARRRRVQEAEGVRTLYVAMTRARDRLVLLGRPPGADGRGGAEGHMALVEARTPAAPDREALMARCAGEARDHADAADTRWVFPDLRRAPEVARREERAPLFADPAAVERDARGLARHREVARASRSRHLHDGVSRIAHEATVEAWREARVLDDPGEEEGGEVAGAAAFGPLEGRHPAGAAQAAGGGEAAARAQEAGRGDGDAERSLATAVGTAVHRALELLDPAADPESAREAARPILAHAVQGLLPPEVRGAALARAQAMVEGFLAGPLGARWRELAPALVARELPVLLPPPPDAEAGPTGFVSGVVDLLYRDPDTGELVVADYKTDRIAAAAALDSRARDYAAQGWGYVRAVEEALGLAAPPRFELWFLDAGVVRVVSAEGGTATS